MEGGGYEPGEGVHSLAEFVGVDSAFEFCELDAASPMCGSGFGVRTGLAVLDIRLEFCVEGFASGAERVLICGWKAAGSCGFDLNGFHVGILWIYQDVSQA